MNTSELLKILACPVCHGELTLEEKEGKPCGFLCPACSLVYPIRDEIPIMIASEAIPLDKWEGKA